MDRAACFIRPDHRQPRFRQVRQRRQRVVRDDYTGKLDAANADLLRLMLAAGYTLLVDRHVRVDIFYAKVTPATRRRMGDPTAGHGNRRPARC